MNQPFLKANSTLAHIIYACMAGTFSAAAFAQTPTAENTESYFTGGMPAIDSASLPTITNGNTALMPQRAQGLQVQNPQNAPTSVNSQNVQQQPAWPQSETTRQARKPSDFEKYVSTVVNDKGSDAGKVRIFGTDLFNGVPTTFSPLSANQVNQEYLIGTGDELQIRGWGMVNIDVVVKVDRAGAIYIPRVGAVNVAGVKYRDLQGYLKQAIGKNFSNFDLAVSISQVRPVQIYVVGHVMRPGTYTLSAMSTLLNALFSSGGPATSGSMRSIEVKRAGKTVTTFDMYDMLLKGDKSHDIALQDGDVVYVPQVGSMVAVTGNVKRPAIFELKGAASFADAVEWAGGFASTADSRQVVVEKNINNEFKTVATLPVAGAMQDPGLAALPLAPADIIRVFAPSAVPVEAAIANEYVRVSGEMKQTGAVQILPGESLRSLIARIGVTDKAYIFATEVTRESVRLMQQEKLDEISRRFIQNIETGASQQLSATTDKDAIVLINAAVDRQRNTAQRLAQIKSKGRIVLELKDGDAQVKNLPDLALRDGDNIVIPRKPDTVDVLGAVFQQNSFIYRQNRTVADYLKLAGGASQAADPSQLYVIRADGTAQSSSDAGWFSSVSSLRINPGDIVVMPEETPHTSWTQSLKEWTSIFYQFGLGAAGLKVLKD